MFLLIIAGFIFAFPDVSAHADTFYVANVATKSVEKFAADGTPSFFASPGNNTFPSGIAVDRAGNVYVVSSTFGGSSITKFPPNGGSGTIFVSTLLSNPQGLAFDRADNLYAANFNNGTITKIATNGVPTVFASDPGTHLILDHPTGLAFDRAGNLFVSNDGSVDDNNARTNLFIEKFTTNGVASRFATDPGDNSILWGPEALAFDPAGNLFVANPDGGFIEKFTSNGIPSLFNDSACNAPGLVFDSAGNLYSLIGDGSSLGTILKFAAGTSVYTVFAADPGNGTVMYSPQFMAVFPDTAASPVLTITKNGTNALISWPAAAGSFTLESKTNLNSSTWNPVTNLLVTIGGNYVVTNAITGSTRFFRLHN